MRKALLAAAVLSLAACRGEVPLRNAPPEQAISAILISGKMVLPSGESRDGRLEIGFETDGGQGEVYRVPVRADENDLFLVEPGSYRLAPTRTLFGGYQPTLTVVIDGRTYHPPFPRELMSLGPYEVKPTKVLALGELVATVLPALPGRTPEVRLRLDDSVAARRDLVQGLIRDMMDPNRPAAVRDSAIAWSRSLQNELMKILSEQDGHPLYTPAP